MVKWSRHCFQRLGKSCCKFLVEFKLQYDWNIVKATSILKTTQHNTNLVLLVITLMLRHLYLCHVQGQPHQSYYAVFDGHAGIDAAVYASTHLHVHLPKCETFNTNPAGALKCSYSATDDDFIRKADREVMILRIIEPWSYINEEYCGIHDVNIMIQSCGNRLHVYIHEMKLQEIM